MLSWFSEEDFMNDADLVSFDPNRVQPRRLANINRSLQSKHLMWYWDSDEDEVVPSRGRGRLPPESTDHLQVMNEIRRDVRSTVGNCYQNESIESFYQVLQNEDSTKYDDAPQDKDAQTVEVTTENVETPTTSSGTSNGMESNVVNGDVRSLSSMLSNGKQYSGRGCKIAHYSAETVDIDIKSNHEFPNL